MSQFVPIILVSIVLDCGQISDAGRDVDRLRVALLDALQEVPQLLLGPDQRLLRLESVSGGTNSMF